MGAWLHEKALQLHQMQGAFGLLPVLLLDWLYRGAHPEAPWRDPDHGEGEIVCSEGPRLEPQGLAKSLGQARLAQEKGGRAASG
jgi:hypothetical protein